MQRRWRSSNWSRSWSRPRRRRRPRRPRRPPVRQPRPTPSPPWPRTMTTTSWCPPRRTTPTLTPTAAPSRRPARRKTTTDLPIAVRGPGTLSGSRARGLSWDGVSVRLRLDVAYDGTDFAGWAVQPERRTVAGVLAAELVRLFGSADGLTVAGRTDAGVHATGQVCHVDVASARWEKLSGSVVRRLAGLLPDDVRVRSV